MKKVFAYKYATMSHNTAEYRNVISFDTEEEMEAWAEEQNQRRSIVVFDWEEVGTE